MTMTMMASETSPVRPRRRRPHAPTSSAITLNARVARDVRGPLITTGLVVSQMPHARVVEISDGTSVGGRTWVVQATFMSVPESDKDWTTIADSKAHDGRMGSRGRKVYATLRKSPAKARCNAEQYMANASQCLAVESALFVEARALLVKYKGAPPFAAVGKFLREAEEREANLRREVSAGWNARVGSCTVPYFYPPPIATIARAILFTPETLSQPIAFDGSIMGRFEPFTGVAE
jgi:hypothetical protein